MREPILKIDMHVHPQFFGGPERLRGGTWPTPEEVRQTYDRIGVEKGVIMPRTAPERMHDPITSRDAEKIAAEYPETFGWWFFFLDPRMGTNSETDDLTYYMDYFKSRGAVGIGELQANLWLDDPRMLNLFAAAEKAGLPVAIHFGIYGQGCGPADELGLPKLEKVLSEFPKLLILGHAMPFWSEISADVNEENRGGYPKGKITEEGRIAKLMRRCPNLLCDLSAGSGYNAITRDREYGLRFLEEFYDRVFYASDYSSPLTEKSPVLRLPAFLDEAYETGDLSERAYKAICRENALRLLSVDWEK